MEADLALTGGMDAATGSLRAFERFYLCCEPFLPPLHRMVRRRLCALADACGGNVNILDVGGRKSHCTIGVRGCVTVTDLPRLTELQHSLNLGVNDEMVRQLRMRRSNVSAVVYDDMTQSRLPSDRYDVAVAVEVLEHVDDDHSFLQSIHRILRPGGVFVMTTPNGDSVPNRNPDHKRHYKRQQLLDVLNVYFSSADVVYAVRKGLWRRLGLKSWSFRRPVQTGLSMVGNVINNWQSNLPGTDASVERTCHLFAVARKAT